MKVSFLSILLIYFYSCISFTIYSVSCCLLLLLEWAVLVAHGDLLLLFV